MRTKQLLMLTAFALSCVCISSNVFARVWRVNNNAGINANFTQVSTAVNSPLVQNGDTIYVEGSATTYTSTLLNKRLVIIGPGYLLNENTGLQLNAEHAFFQITVDSAASGSTLIGLYSTIGINSDVDNFTVTRCRGSISQNSTFPNSKIQNLVINKCYISINISALLENPQITNSLIVNSFSMTNVINGLVRNNNINGITIHIANTYFSNNMLSGFAGLSATNCTVKHNISTGNASTLPAGNNNQTGIAFSTLCVNTGSTDGQYQLRPGSPALNAGETIGGVSPHIGMFGTADPYRLSGIPPIPTIYALSVPASIPATATSMSITFSTRSNN